MTNQVRIVGQDEGREFNAAQELASLFQQQMREGDQLTIIVGLKCIGEVKQDIDLVCLGTVLTS